jgi:hypothetical protein
VAGLTAAVVILFGSLLALGLRSSSHPGARPELPSAPDQQDEVLQISAELDRQDPGWRVEEIEARRKNIPDDQNAALRAQAIKRLLPSEWPEEAFKQLLATVQDPPPVLRLKEHQVRAMRAELQRLAPALAEARRLADFSEGRHLVFVRRDWLSTSVPHIQSLRSVASLLQADALLRAEEGDLAGAVASCSGALNAGRSLGDEPLGMAQLVRIACAAVSVRALERVLAQGEPPEAGLALLQELLEKEAAHPALLIAARGERGGLHCFLTAVEAGDVKLPKDWLTTSEGLVGGGSIVGEPQKPAQFPPDWDSPASIRHAHAWLLRHFTRYVEIARLPPHEQPRQVEKWEAAAKEAPPAARPLLYGGRKLVTASLRIQARLRSAATAVAAERYRQAHGQWPKTLSALRPALLREVPADPYDGAPLRYRRLADGVVVYAVGMDREDNKGALDEKAPERPGADVGFRLWGRSQRRQAPRPG